MNHSLNEVVIVNDSAHINGGSSHVALSSAIALAQAGAPVTVFAAVGPVMPELLETPNLRLILTNQYEIVSDPSRARAATQGIWNLSAANSFGHMLEQLDPEHSIIHAHGWTKALSSSVFRVALDKKFRTIITLHEYFTACPNGSFYNHQRQEICTLDPMSLRCIRENCDSRSYPQKLWRVARQAVQRTIGAVPAGIKDFITISDFSEAILAPLLPTTARLHRVNNPIDAKCQMKVPVDERDAFTYVGRLSPEKGVILFARAAKDAGVKAVFVGDGECADAIRQCNQTAIITGWLPRDGVNEYLQKARALVFPSLWYENSPLVISEAAALGVPAIVADTSAARQYVADGLTGRYFRGHDATSLTAALVLLKNAPLAAILGAEAYRRYWTSPRPMTRHISDLTRVYERVMHNAA